jgi:hypothetical protein
MKSEETVRGRLGSVITGVGVQGEESSLGSSLSSCLTSWGQAYALRYLSRQAYVERPGCHLRAISGRNGKHSLLRLLLSHVLQAHDVINPIRYPML